MFSQSQSGLTGKKAALIVGLSGVLWWVWPSSQSSTPSATSLLEVGTAVAENLSQISSASRSTSSDEPALSLEELIAENPFQILSNGPATSSSTAEQAAGTRTSLEEELDRSAAVLPALKLQAVLGTGPNAIALIDGQPYRVGDRLTDRLEITHIGSTGIEVRELPTAD